MEKQKLSIIGKDTNRILCKPKDAHPRAFFLSRTRIKKKNEIP